ncbi:MAG TPA: glycosyltransferase family 4 protein [Chthoniobacteraceae bacterium]|nr:glycosyltransferase family 4 protein [Chthoniobacteraceae bacterium]
MSKIAHITTIDASLRFLLLNQMLSLRKEGYSVTGISLPGGDVPAIEHAGIRHIPVNMTRNFTPLADLVSLWQLYKVFRRERFTIVHTHTPKAGLLGQLAARLAGVPLVVNTLHGLYFHEHMSAGWRYFYIAMEKVAAQCSDRILSQNREDIQTVLREGICKPEKILLLGNGINIDQFDPARVKDEEMELVRKKYHIPASAPVVGFVGRLSGKRKGFLDFLAAARELARRLPEACFLVVGEPDKGKPDAVDASIAKEYGIADRCLFTGHIPNADLPPIYKIMNVLALPSLFEGLPRVVMEASAMGIPAVVTNVKGNREAVEAERNGLLVPLGDARALAAAMERILSQPELAKRMSLECRRIALERFDEERVFETIKTEYLALLQGRRTPEQQGERAFNR